MCAGNFTGYNCDKNGNPQCAMIPIVYKKTYSAKIKDKQ
jgi:hypothetical protein